MNRLETELRCAPSLSSFLVQGFSMRGLLRSGEQVWVDQNYYTCHPVVRGDLVIVQVPRRERTLIKSIQALPGDEISLVPAPQGAGFMLLVNREPVQAASGGKPYFFTQARSEVLAAGLDQGKLPEGRYLVLGTLPGGTTDSSEFGSIPLDWIQGRVVRTGNRILTH